MLRSRRSLSSRVLVTAAAALIGIGLAAPVARADGESDVVTVAPEAVAAATLDAAAATVPAAPLADTTAQGVVDAVMPAPAESTPVASPSSDDGATPASEPAPAPPVDATPDPGSEPAPAAAEPAASPSSTTAAPPLGGDPVDDTGAASDTTAPSPVSPPAPAPDPAPVAQVGAVNVNVSIRIESPGDTGSVTQVNEVDAASTLAIPKAPAAAGDIATDTGDDSGEPASDMTPDRTCESQNGCCTVVTLVIACVDADGNAFSISDIGDLLDTMFANIFTNSPPNAQPPATAIQYAPVNVNISIRIWSPGDDGPVMQANVVQIGTAVSVQIPVLAPRPAPSDGSAADPVAPAQDEGEVSSAPATVEPEPTSADETLLAPVAVGVVMPPVARTTPTFPTIRISVLQTSISLGGIVISPSFRLGQAPEALWKAEQSVRRGAVPTGGSEGGGGDAGTRRGAHRVPAPVPAPILPPLEASLAPVSVGAGGGGGGLPLALALPFAIGLLDVGVRRVRASRLTPSDHVGGRPERPG